MQAFTQCGLELDLFELTIATDFIGSTDFGRTEQCNRAVSAGTTFLENLLYEFLFVHLGTFEILYLSFAPFGEFLNARPKPFCRLVSKRAKILEQYAEGGKNAHQAVGIG
jgi:hypothetical protein